MKKKIATDVKEPIKLRTKQLANGSKSIYLDIYRNGVREYEFLKLYLIPERNRLDKQRNEETLRTAYAIKSQRIVSLQNAEYGFSVAHKSKINFIAYMRAQVNSYKERNSIAYSKSVRVTIEHLKMYRGENITLNQVNKSFLLGFIDYLDKVESKHHKPLSEASKTLYYNVVSIALNKAVKDDLIPLNPATKILYSDRPRKGNATKEYLTLDEVKELIKTPCKYDMLKRAFLFACFCGLRYSDIRRLTWNKMHKVDGNKFQVEIKQQKTGETLYLPLSENALSWLPEQKETNDNIFLLPNSTTTIEKHLGIWSKTAGINKHITFHLARHITFSYPLKTRNLQILSA